ncbi:MAG: SUF system NifU family Fe-S cluster assembly protein [Chloroflexi bacterium]|nr:SUF system NifU family Fe-S cluster assembly protein [Chloroflexota bacterium]|tara:strand:+ start:43704 stop:44156 length:453 start_codon:yes stop_codon:yes gene_type:complete
MYDIEELYQEIIIDHSRNPRNFGKLDTANKTAEGYNPLCGDQITLYIELKDKLINKIKFSGSGCAISKASASLMTEAINQKTESEAIIIFNNFRQMITKTTDEDYDSDILGDLEILKGVSAFPARIKCATLAWHALKSILDNNNQEISTE